MVHATYFSIIVGYLYKMGNDEIPRRYAVEFEQSSILADAHQGTTGGHHVRRATVQKILHVRLWWPTLHEDSKAHCKACDVCQRTNKPSRRDEMPLNPQLTLQPFGKLAIDFVGPIKPQGKM